MGYNDRLGNDAYETSFSFPAHLQLQLLIKPMNTLMVDDIPLVTHQMIQFPIAVFWVLISKVFQYSFVMVTSIFCLVVIALLAYVKKLAGCA